MILSVLIMLIFTLEFTIVLLLVSRGKIGAIAIPMFPLCMFIQVILFLPVYLLIYLK